jgi:thiol-disulfide isomerase/thioredoxin
LNRLLLALALLGLISGCEAKSAGVAVRPGSVLAEPEIQLEVASWDDVQTMVGKHAGKVVVVDLWSTSCIPCVREFPQLVELHKAHADNVACISVSVDYTGAEEETPESLREKIAAFLDKRNATFQNVICSDPDLELYDRIDLGAVPAVYVFDREGELKKRFDNDHQEYGDEGFTYAQHIVPLVEQLVGE